MCWLALQYIRPTQASHRLLHGQPTCHKSLLSQSLFMERVLSVSCNTQLEVFWCVVVRVLRRDAVGLPLRCCVFCMMCLTAGLPLFSPPLPPLLPPLSGIRLFRPSPSHPSTNKTPAPTPDPTAAAAAAEGRSQQVTEPRGPRLRSPSSSPWWWWCPVELHLWSKTHPVWKQDAGTSSPPSLWKQL